MATTRKSTKAYEGFSEEERAAMKEHAKELKSKEDPAEAQAAKIAGMVDADRVIAERLSVLIPEVVPELTPKLWYGMPAWYKDGKLICFFQDAAKFKARYPTLGFSDKAALDDGDMWPTSYALTKLTPTLEKQIAGLVRKAAG